MLLIILVKIELLIYPEQMIIVCWFVSKSKIPPNKMLWIFKKNYLSNSPWLKFEFRMEKSIITSWTNIDNDWNKKGFLLPLVHVILMKVKFWNNTRVELLLILTSPIKKNEFDEEKFKLEKLLFIITIWLLFPITKLDIVVFLK